MLLQGKIIGFVKVSGFLIFFKTKIEKKIHIFKNKVKLTYIFFNF